MAISPQLDRLRAALPYSSGAARREIAAEIATEKLAAEPLRWCAWCGETLAPSVAGEFCNDECRAEDAAAASVP